MPGRSKVIESKYQRQTNLLTKILDLAKLLLRNEVEIKTFPDKKKSLIMTRLGIQQMLKRVLQVERISNSGRKT